ncbi:MAG: sugar transferase [Smithellaceae bacterium]
MNLPLQVPYKRKAVIFGDLMNQTVRYEQQNPGFYDEKDFRHILRVERMRTERSKKPFLLLLIDVSRFRGLYRPEEALFGIQLALIRSLREIDVRGWYHKGQTIGILFTEVLAQEPSTGAPFIQNICDRLSERMDAELIEKMDISFHHFPETEDVACDEGTFNVCLYPDVIQRRPGRRISLAVKKMMDVAGSAIGLVFLTPLFLAIAAAIKATSRGPVFYRQERVGLNGKTFNMLKFRTMKTNCDSAQHQNYVKKFICDQKNAAVEPGVYKLMNDSRITMVGRILRRTSLDELPQLINVLKGDMSLVGPRPPIPYECELYDLWHRRRLLSCMPGITGLWQVAGRSRTTFDEMVRLDLKYIREWSLWLDMKILFRTPGAVVNGSGAL